MLGDDTSDEDDSPASDADNSDLGSDTATTIDTVVDETDYSPFADAAERDLFRDAQLRLTSGSALDTLRPYIGPKTVLHGETVRIIQRPPTATRHSLSRDDYRLLNQ